MAAGMKVTVGARRRTVGYKVCMRDEKGGCMAHLLDYLGYEFATFDNKPLGPVDSAALTQAVMLSVEGVVPGLGATPTGFKGLVDRLKAAMHRSRPVHFADLVKAERFEGMFTGLVPEALRQHLFALAASPRFRELELRDYQSVFNPTENTQFAAMTFVYRDQFAYLAFRGTDTSLTGWRENFDMAYMPTVPAQELALDYVERVVPRLPGRVYVGGHSKGGNLALFAALCCSDAVCERIERVWVHDAPGFRAGRFGRDRYERLAGKLDRTLPQDSIVGMLMECCGPYRVVHADATGMNQHSVFTWEVDGDDFVYVDRVSDASEALHDIVSTWIGGYDADHARRVVDAIFAAIEASGASDAAEILLGGPSKLPLLTEAAKHIDPEARGVLRAALADLANIAVRRVGHDILSALPWAK